MAKRYVRPALRTETFNIFKQRHQALNRDLKDMGVKHGVPFTRFMDLVARKSRVGEDHIHLAFRKEAKK